MGLTLTTLRCPDAVPPETRRLEGGEFSIGRGPGNDWVLPDTARHLSKRHCVLAYRSGAWQLTDTSSNGTFLNRTTAPVGTGAPKTLRDGDRIRIGEYELEVSLTEETPILAPPRAGNAQGDGLLPPVPLDPFAYQPGSNWGDGDPLPESERPSHGLSAALPHDFTPIGQADPFGSYTRPDHTPAINDAFRPPPLAAASIPDDWNFDLNPKPAFAPPNAPSGHLVPILPDFDDLLAPLPAAPPPTFHPGVPPPAAAEPMPRPAQQVARARMPIQAHEPPREDLLAAFLEGAGITDAPADPAGALRAVGAVLRAAVSGIRQTLIARASIKGEFRIEQTMVRASGNNPLKFSANDDDAIAGLLGIGRRTAMPADKAMADALRDVRLHELATVTAMQSAVRALLARFDPSVLESGLGHGTLDKLPGQRKARAWEAFAAIHATVSQALSDDFDSVFGKAFARAYEQALKEAQDGDERA